MSAISVTPTTKNFKSTPKDKPQQPSAVNPGKSTAHKNTNVMPTRNSTPLEASFSRILQTDSAQNSSKSTFILQKENYERSDDTSTISQNNFSNPKFCNSIRMTMMFKVPSKKDGCSDKDAPIAAIQKMNEMLKALSNKLPCRVGPWLDTNLKNGKLKIQIFFPPSQKILILLNHMYMTTIDSSNRERTGMYDYISSTQTSLQLLK